MSFPAQANSRKYREFQHGSQHPCRGKCPRRLKQARLWACSGALRHTDLLSSLHSDLRAKASHLPLPTSSEAAGKSHLFLSSAFLVYPMEKQSAVDTSAPACPTPFLSSFDNCPQFSFGEHSAPILSPVGTYSRTNRIRTFYLSGHSNWFKGGHLKCPRNFF